jgi:hypothetical protein
MIQFTTTLLKFGEQGEKTGWTYILVSAKLAEKLKPNNKQSFRVKGKLDNFSISKVALMPMGEGDFIMPVNAAMRKGIKKQKGAEVKVQLSVDNEPLKPPAEFIECLKDDPDAMKGYNKLARSHKNYFTRWIDSAKTDETKAKRIAAAVNALSKGFHFGEMMRAMKEDRQKLL